MIIFFVNIIFHEIFQLKTTFGRRPLEDDFPNFGFENKEKTHIYSHGELRIIYNCGGGGRNWVQSCTFV